MPVKSITIKIIVCLIELSFISINEVVGYTKHSGEYCARQSEIFANQISERIKIGDYEAIASIAEQWEQLCGLTEPIFRVNVLMSIYNGKFPAGFENYDLLSHAIAFEIRNGLIGRPSQQLEYFESYPEYFGYLPPGNQLDFITKQWATELKSEPDKNDMAHLFLQLYAGHPELFFGALHSGRFYETELGQDYLAMVEKNLRLVELNMGVNSGLWQPLGSPDLVGIKPLIGIVIGAKTQNWFFDALIEVRFGESRRYIYLPLRDTLVSTNNFQSVYLGLEFTRILLRGKTGGVEIFGGAGYDIIDIVEEGHLAEGITLRSPAAHIGVGYRFHFPNRTWLSIKPGFYYTNHQRQQFSPISGSALNLRITFGFSENVRKSTNLKRLGLNQWW